MPSQVDYKKLARENIVRPANVKRMPRILVYSRNKKGKTTFCLSVGVDNILILDPERGSDEFKQTNPHVWHIRDMQDMDNAYEFLRHVNECQTCDTPHPFSWVGVDGLTKISNIALKRVMRLEEEKSLTRIPGMVQQRDYGKGGELMKDMLSKFHNLKQGIIFTAQERMIGAADSEEDDDLDEATEYQFVPDLANSVRGASNAIVDVIGRIYVVRTEDDPPKAERRLWVGPSVRYDTGYRSDFVLPDMIQNPTVPKLVRLMRTGSATPTKAKKKGS